MTQRWPANTMKVGGAILAGWILKEGFSSPPYIPTKGDVPTIGHGSTQYEDGRKVKLTDPPITRKRAEELALHELDKTYGRCVKKRLGDALVSDTEWRLAVDFAGNYGCYRYEQSSIATETVNGNYEKACRSYRLYKFQAKRDCSLSINWGPNGCKGVWLRSLKREADCLAQL